MVKISAKAEFGLRSCRVRQVLIGVLLIFDALLNVLIVEVEFVDAMVGAVAGVVVDNNGFEGHFFFVRVYLVVGLFLWQIFLELADVGHILFVLTPGITRSGLCGRGKNAGDVEWLELFIFGLLFRLHALEQLVIGYGVVDRCGGQKGVELAPVGGGIMFLKDGFVDPLGEMAGFTNLNHGFNVARKLHFINEIVMVQ